MKRHETYLLSSTASGEVADGPSSLLARLEVPLGNEVDQQWDQVCVNDGLNLSVCASSDVRDGPVIQATQENEYR
jgi:hypothetical protein